MKKTFSALLFSLALMFTLTPSIAFAQGQQQPQPDQQGTGESQPSELELRIGWLLDFVDGYVIPLIFGLAFVVFIWFVFVYFILGGAEEEQRAKGKQFLLWSLIGFVLMLSLWGIVNLLQNTIGFDNNSKPCLPVFEQDNEDC
ncbi:MAG: hypothetical protein KBC38_00140 [Candidatus Pacebacteria bacterium]|nr:hypothetical protein [Candidatus Paceibacterota bacterium]MBP9840412.1 hypothetical protein [Candidatus Paceibacterota bacterium]